MVKFKSGKRTLTIDITDHLPIFSIVKTQPPRNNNNNRTYYRDYSEFDNQCFIDDVKSIDWHSILDPDESLNDKAHEAISTLNVIVDKHAPIRLASRSKQKLLDKPWLTKGILKSIKKKQKMYRSYFLSKDPEKINKYKRYSNILSRLKSKNKEDYYTMQFSKYKDNLKQTWKIFGSLINRKTKGQISPSRIIHNNDFYKRKGYC